MGVFYVFLKVCNHSFRIIFEKYFMNAVEFFRGCIASYEHSGRGTGDFWKVYKPETQSRVGVTVSNFPNSSCVRRVYMKLCKRGKSPLLLLLFN